MNKYPTYRFITGPVTPVQRRRFIVLYNGTGSGKTMKIINVGTYTRPSASHAAGKPNLLLTKVSNAPSAFSTQLTALKFDLTDPDLTSLISGLEQVTSGANTTISVYAGGSQAVDDNTQSDPNYGMYINFPSKNKQKSLTLREGEFLTLTQDNFNVAVGNLVSYIDFYVI